MQADAIRAHGIDGIYCLSVNDWFVMDACRDTLGIDDSMTMLPDGNTDFTTQMGMLVDKRELGFGLRSWRYAMIVRNGVIESIFVEDTEDPGDPFEVSSAPFMLAHLS
jgi:peroxiredoxin